MKRDKVALVDESRCIGCTLCIGACPVDAIVGAQTLMHTVVEPWCIGCGLCLPPCPVDCIDMVPAQGKWTHEHKQAAKHRATRRKTRLSSTRIVSVERNRKTVIAEALARKKR